MVVVEEAGGIASHKVVGDVEGFDGGEAALGIVAVVLAAGVGCAKVRGDAAMDERRGDLAGHDLGKAPGGIDEEKTVGVIRRREGWGIEGEADVAIKWR